MKTKTSARLNLIFVLSDDKLSNYVKQSEMFSLCNFNGIMKTIWSEERMPSNCKRVGIVLILTKGNREECYNYKRN